jgi:hypothetical protein
MHSPRPTPVKAPSAPLAAVVTMHVAAALLGVPCRAFAKRVRRGEVAGAVRGFDRTGYIIGWRAMEALLVEALDSEELEEARARLHGVRAGALRVIEGEFLPIDGYKAAATDGYLDDELKAEVERAARELGAAVYEPSEFDRWAAERAPGLNHRDVAARLSASTSATR